ncbi:MAG: MarR family transcriptional regulator [Pseudomonadota bacterium]
MTILHKQILSLIVKSPGLTDREITNALRGVSAPQQPINQAARSLESQGVLVRLKRDDGLIGNYVTEKKAPMVPVLSPSSNKHDVAGLSEDEIKKVLKVWLSEQGWNVKIAMGQVPGIDIDAIRGKERWIIEVKGTGSRPQMRVNYFLCILGETLQRMDDPAALYSLALPDLEQFRKLWARLPILAKDRTQISVLFVSKSGAVAHAR